MQHLSQQLEVLRVEVLGFWAFGVCVGFGAGALGFGFGARGLSVRDRVLGRRRGVRTDLINFGHLPRHLRRLFMESRGSGE